MSMVLFLISGLGKTFLLSVMHRMGLNKKVLPCFELYGCLKRIQ
jgi:hypothetical protein